MTSRLKHKLELENVNLNSAYLNESFVQIGTPLPALAETKKDKQEYLPVWQQEARDEKGRRRFHGAWTGGFTAGYGNTVGSKEGWKPSTFKSSRSNRATKVQRPEDFMDEEDLKEMNEDRRLENTDVFKDDGFRGTKEEVEGKSIPSVLESMIAPARTSIGQTLLQKLGWRPGQGIGPRVSRRKLKLQEARLGGKGVVDEGDEEMDETENSKHTYAPRDVRLVTYESKDDRAGLGFEKGRGMGRLTGKIGPGDDPDEEDDPYAEAGPSTRPHLVFEPDEEDEVIVMGGPVLKSSGPLSEKPHGNDKNHWHDGKPVLPNFELDPLSVPTDKWFEFPEIPPDWRPRPARVWGTTRKWDELPGTKTEEKDTIRGVPGRPLTFEQRGEALGEEQHLSKARSVGEYMYEKEKERLSSLQSTINQPPPLPPLPLSTIELEEITNSQRPTSVEIPPLSPRTASAALRGYIPYGDDLNRQERYRSYLISQTYNTTQPDPILRSGSVDEINKELEDFASSARIFKPLSHAMSSRFTSGSTSLAANDMKEVKPGLHMYDATKVKLDLDSQQPLYEEVSENKVLTPREQAAQNGMYGTLTRVVKDFYPVKLLCKRFGVPDPHPEGEPKNIVLDNERSEDLPKNDANWEKAFVHQSIPSQFGKPDSTTGVKDEKNEEGEERVPRNLGEVGMAEDVNQGRDTLNYTKPTIDIFKAIFASDDESEDEEDDRQGVSHPTNLELKVGKEMKVKEDKFEDPFPIKEKTVDINNFKPVFNKKDKNIFDKEKKKEEKEKKKKKRKGVLSFDVGEEELGFKKKKLAREKSSLSSTFQNTERQDEVMMIKRESEMEVENDEGEWVEKPNVVPRSIGRKGAADFM
ncbi:hypothetical protein TREMEDRAFT_27509 [Tremella mesenterica DSM 1558]|uniref:uncharacterized protein n=1 Tax=Tremella mesenterica (strain ATCC 24925 / CBS 8224 / DSM 1558 / NBRC 9311 / NRRL Y-6157 / RJB 2259-6 / UBC 559-6) TaxID=578456 RepID=UPI0003F49445|nr:uncharacterized protein TREMEDRAFT_27509 [Tremella mesenterica DSM 1558]EIW71722.1 hypothetical protein TREMEDRAFT_27509 [Tremella mesenterica DSM 1558]